MFAVRKAGRALLGAALAAAPLLAAPTAHAETTLRVARGWETGFAVGGLTLMGLAELERNALVPHRCDWCEPLGVDHDAQSALRWDSPRSASLLSNVGVAVAPVAAIGSLWLANTRGPWTQRYDDALLVTESVAITMLLTDTAKLLVARERPRVHRLSPAERDARPFDPEDNLSFFSSHTSFAFSLACSAGTVASLRGYGAAPIIWGGGLALATSVGYLRIAADAHYASDVVVGALVGSAVGVAVPLLHRHETSSSVAIQPLGAGAARGLTLSGVF